MNLRTPIVFVACCALAWNLFSCPVVAQDFFATTPPPASYGYIPPATGVPSMPPPPSMTLAPPPTMSSAISGPVVAMQPPVVSAPPIAQGFGTGVAPMAPGGPPAMFPAQPQPYYTQPMLANPADCWYDPQQYVKFMQSVRLRYTWLAGGDDPSEFGVNDAELAATFAWNNWIFTNQPLLITPGFILSLWDPPAILGTPEAIASNITSEIPPRVYSAYLDFYWTPHLTERLTVETNFRIGVYSDFESVGSDAIRPQGYLAGIWQTSPTLALKLGAAYINRVEYELLPVGGVIWTPNQFTHFDITFPNPKLSHYGWTWGSTDVWWYLAAEYGGGTWEIEQLVNNENTLMDLDDIRAILGFEWTGGYIGAKGFVEVGYVFNRKIVIDSSPRYEQDLDSTFMLRGGLAF